MNNDTLGDCCSEGGGEMAVGGSPGDSVLYEDLDGKVLWESVEDVDEYGAEA